jgi:Na+/melibiose symporter-like transporter
MLALAGIVIVWRYPLDRAAHARILAQLTRRRREDRPPDCQASR